MPAKAGMQGGEGVTNTENLDSRFRGKDGRGPQLRAEGWLVKVRE